MLSLSNCLKISYQNEMSCIMYQAGTSYEEVLARAAEHFGIPEDQQYALVLSNGKGGYIFEPRLFEYFILLFPSPEVTFHLRVDYQQLRRGVNKASKRKHPEYEESVPANQERSESEKNNDKESNYPDYVLVYRQNCFLGALPTTCAAPVRPQNCFLREQQKPYLPIVKQQADDDEDDGVVEQPRRHSFPKAKRLRLELCSKPSRRSTSSLISNAPGRSIRI